MSKGLRIAGAIGVALAALIFAFAVGRPIKVLPRMAPAPPFELLDPWGKTGVSATRGRKDHPLHLRRAPRRRGDGPDPGLLR